MVFHRFLIQLCAILFLCSGMAAPVHAEGARGPSTAEENARIVQLAAAADKDPIAVMTSADGRWFEKWADEVPDYHFGPDNGAFWMMRGAAKGDLKRVLRFHHTLSAAAFQVQHHISDPAKNKEQLEAKTLAGVEGLLRAYESLLLKRPENRSEELDQAIALRDKGGLAEFVKALPPMPAR
jgi:carboxypeptidase Q